MPTLKVGIQLSSLRIPLNKALQVAAQLGADAVEIDARGELQLDQMGHTGIRHLRKQLADNNLSVCAVGFRTRRGYHVEEDLDRRVEATKRVMKLAYELGAPVVVNQVGPIPADDQDANWQLLVEVLRDLGHYGMHNGAILAAETGTEPGEQMARLLAAVPDGSIGVTLDPGNLIVNRYSPVDAIASLGSLIRYVHAKDSVFDLAHGRGQQVPLGRGSADFPELIGALEEHGYRGFWTIEREFSDDPVTDIGRSVQYLRSMS